MERQQWWALGHTSCCVEGGNGATRREMAVTFGQEIRKLAHRRALADIERDPAVVSLVRRDADARIELERPLPLDADPEISTEPFPVVMQGREGFFPDAPRS